MLRQNNHFIDDVAITILKILQTKGYVIDRGLKDNEIVAVEKAFNASLPPDLKIFLRAGVIIGAPPSSNSRVISNEYFPNWRDPKGESARCRDFIERAFSSDIKRNNYWSEQFGEKLHDLDDAVRRVTEAIKAWPPLFPIHSHRFICSSPHKAGNPILSIWQATDTVYYGADLLAHLNMDFNLGMSVAEGTPEVVPYWSEAFGLV